MEDFARGALTAVKKNYALALRRPEGEAGPGLRALGVLHRGISKRC